MIFEWDPEKNRKNIEKHGVSFQTAALVFADDDRIDVYDTKHSIDEDRFCTIGKVKEVLFVVYTERKDAVRIISARLASPQERRLYYDNSIYPF